MIKSSGRLKTVRLYQNNHQPLNIEGGITRKNKKCRLKLRFSNSIVNFKIIERYRPEQAKSNCSPFTYFLIKKYAKYLPNQRNGLFPIQNWERYIPIPAQAADNQNQIYPQQL
ncbi:hypothetical protein ACTHSQ_03845 [Neisseria sp. P0009.S008]|uniref:hypothetical protein n=1 Tax=unclassified Neisseria TaxID=2623750 RepID=UPI003F7F8F5D